MLTENKTSISGSMSQGMVGNSISQTITFGRIAGENAAKLTKNLSAKSGKKVSTP